MLSSLSAEETQLLVAGVAVASGLVGWLGRGLSFVLVRWWTGSPKQERAAYLSTVADFGVKLRTSGMTMADVAQLEEIMRAPAVGSSPAALHSITGIGDDDEPDAFVSNYAMKARTGAAYEVAQVQLNQALMDLRLLVGDEAWKQVEVVQQKWEAYRRELESYALERYKGGTHATLALTLAGLAETERRMTEIKAEVTERSSR